MIRRQLLTGLMAAPLIVRDYSILMPVRGLRLPFMYLHLRLPVSGHYVKHWCSRESLTDILRHYPGAAVADLRYYA
jgi:hypothetical protein